MLGSCALGDHSMYSTRVRFEHMPEQSSSVLVPQKALDSQDSVSFIIAKHLQLELNVGSSFGWKAVRRG